MLPFFKLSLFISKIVGEGFFCLFVLLWVFFHLCGFHTVVKSSKCIGVVTHQLPVYTCIQIFEYTCVE